MKTSRYTTHGLLLLALGCFHAASHAAPADLTDTPLPVQSSVPPNIMFMIDKSGSMGSIVPTVNDSVNYGNCPGTGTAFAGGTATPITAGADGTWYSVWVNGATGALQVLRNGSSLADYGTGTGKFCFDPSLYYMVGLDATYDFYGNWYSGSLAIYKGNYLNWYFGSSADKGVPDTFGTTSGNRRKSGAQTRLEVAKSAAKTVITGLDTTRVGLFSYGPDDAGVLLEPIGTLDAAKRTAMNTKIDALTADGWTPLAETLASVGNYFTTGYSGNLKLHPAASIPTNASIADVFPNGFVNNSGTTPVAAPIQQYCQKSFTVFLTDGMPTQDQSVSSSLREYYGYCSGTNANCTGSYGKRNFKLDSSGAVTSVAELYERAGNNPSDYLDDVANALYDIDLRPDLVVSATTPKSGKNNLTTYMIGFADPTLDYTTLLERSALYGGGLSFTASDSASLASAFSNITNDILAKDGSAAAVAVANAHVTNTDNASYATSYNSGVWTGDLIAYPINTITGAPNINAPIWNTGCTNPSAYVDSSDTSKGVLGCSAQVQLDTLAPASRKIFTMKDVACLGDCGVPFQPSTVTGVAGTDKLSVAQQTLLNTPGQTDGAAVVDYLRGVRTGEIAGTYRTRAHVLGDMVNGEPLVIREPDRNYVDLNYSTFKTSNKNRTRIIFQVSNDGMAHAFDSLTGAELWAYVPNMLISNAKDPANSSTSLLNTRSRRTSFNHYFLLDGTPVTGDVDFANSGATGVLTTDWRTIVVGGMGKGGRGYYAIDFTSTTAASEATAASKALWEFPASITNTARRNSAFANMGYSFGKPVIVKTAAMGWVVLLTSGYNNGTGAGGSGGDGKGHLYVVNAKTGDLIEDLVTTGCHDTPATNACGLAHVNAYIENKDKDNTAELAYGGDLYGNLWRFDLRGNASNGWSVSRMATLRSGNTATSAVQPITTVPELAKIITGGVAKYYVYVGTGMFLGKTDLPCPPSPTSCAWSPNAQSTQTQTMYGLIDTRTTTTLPDPLLPTLQPQTYTTTGNTRVMTANAVASSQNGWYVNFTGGERLVTDPGLASGTLVFTSSIPSTTPCVPGGSSWLYAIDYATGGKVTDSTYGGTFLGDALASRPVLIQLPDGRVMALIRLSDTTTVIKQVPAPGNPASSKRVSWRELIDN